jgi:sugar lactone lactonase YvrE
VYPAGGTAPVAVSDITVAPNGDIWVVGQRVDTADNTTSFGPSWISRFDGIHWTLPEHATWLSPDTWSTGIAAAADGTIWTMAQGGLARFDGTRWTRLYETLSFSAISVAPDGTVWANGPSGVVRLPAP